MALFALGTLEKTTTPNLARKVSRLELHGGQAVADAARLELEECDRYHTRSLYESNPRYVLSSKNGE